MRITAAGVTRIAELSENPTAEAIWNALPITGTTSRWGDEIYFRVPVELEAEDDARETVEVGQVAYWPPGSAVCIFWGPTPASSGKEPRAASPVTVFAHIGDGATQFGTVPGGASIRLEAV